MSPRTFADPGRAAAKRAAARGYTMIEVMMALGVLAVGAAGVIAMQKAAVVGNASAKSIATATAIATRWAERLRADAMLWNTSDPTDIADTRFLNVVETTPDMWTLPAVLPGEASPLADPLGADIILAGDTSITAYCTHVSYRYIPAKSPPPAPQPKMVSAVVRVTWRRDWSAIDCSAADLSDYGRYGAVYLTTGFTPQERL